MHINWFTFAAQIVNFLILLALLRHFLFRRVLAMMDERERTIRSRMEEAEKKRAEAEQQAEAHRRERDALEQERAAILAKARAEVDGKRAEMLAEARKGIDERRSRWREEFERQKESFFQELRTRVATETIALTRKALHDLADEDLEERIVRVFRKKLDDLDEKEGKKLAAAAGRDGSAVVASAFDLPKGARERLEKELGLLLGDGVKIAFETSPAVEGGLEVRAGGERMAWSLAQYLDGFEDRLSGALAVPGAGHTHGAEEEDEPDRTGEQEAASPAKDDRCEEPADA